MIKILSYQSNEWWNTLTVTQQKSYLKLHPKSKRKVKQGGPKPAKKPANVAPALDAKGKKSDSKRTSDQDTDNLIFKTDIKNEIEAGQNLIQRRVPGNTKHKMKKEVTEVLASELTGKLDLPTGEDFLRHVFISAGSTVGRYAPIEKQFVSMIIERWARSSTSNVSSLVQLRVAKMFGTDPTIRGSSADTPWKLRKATDQAKLEKAIDIVIDHMYNKTQELLKANGVKGLYLHRGFFPVNYKTDVALQKGNQTLSKRTIQLNPMSSFTSSPKVAERFGRFIIHTYVPAKRILTTCITGLGCLDEAEYVVIGSAKPKRVFMSNVKAEGYKSDMPKIWDYVKRGKEIAMSSDFVIHVDEGDNADWTKKTWNLDFKYGSPEYKAWLKKNGMTDQDFRKTTAYRLGVKGKKDVEYKEESTIASVHAKVLKRIREW